MRNDGREAAAAAVEEVVGAGVTVVATDPPAAFTEDRGAGGGTLRWDLSDLPPGETRRLTVGVVPDEGAGELVTAARVVAAVRVAAATVVRDADEESFESDEPLPEPFGPASDAFDPADDRDAPPLDDFGGGFEDDAFGGVNFGDPVPEDEPDDPSFEDDPSVRRRAGV